MSAKRLVAKNIVWNWLGMATELIVGLVTVSLLISTIGASQYGLWILIGSLTGYFGLLDLGIRGSVGRYVAYFRGQNDLAAVNHVLNSALAVLAITALIAMAIASLILPLLPAIISFPAELTASVRLAFMLSATALALSLVLCVFDATLWGCQRFDLLNCIDIPNALLRLALTYWVAKSGFGIVGLACIAIATTVLAGLAKGATSLWVMPSLQFGVRLISQKSIRLIAGYGSWLFGKNVVLLARRTVLPLLVGAWYGLGNVAAFAVALRLVTQATSVVIAATGVVTPLVARLDASGDGYLRQRRLFIHGGRLCMVLALVFCTVFVVLGRSLIALWLGPEMATVSGLLAILAIGELLPMSQCLTEALLLGTANTRALFVISLIDTSVLFSALALFSSVLELQGVCIVIATTGTLLRGVVPLVYGCRLTRVSAWEFTTQILMPAILVCAIPALLLAWLAHFREPTSWPELALYAGTFVAGCGLAAVAYFRRSWSAESQTAPQYDAA